MWASLVASIVPIVLGSLATYFKPFIESQADFRSRIKLRREALLEQLADKHADLLQHVRRVMSDDLLRGYGLKFTPDDLPGVHGGKEPDLVGDLTRETFRLFAIFHRLETLRIVYRSAHTVLLVTVCLAIFGALAACLWVGARPWIPYVMYILIAVQVCFFALLYWSSWKLETYEDVT